MLPMFWGITKKDPKYEFLIAAIYRRSPGKTIYIASLSSRLEVRKIDLSVFRKLLTELLGGR